MVDVRGDVLRPISLPPTPSSVLSHKLTLHSSKWFPMVSRQLCSSILVQVCQPHKHLTLYLQMDLVWHNISKWRPRSRGGTGQPSKDLFILQFMKRKTLDYLWSINCINVSIHGYNCCQTGIQLSIKLCIFSCHGSKNRTYSWQSKSRFFSKCISDGHASRNMGHN